MEVLSSDIGLKSDTLSGFSFLGTNVIKEELIHLISTFKL
jgi:hypothetical protein